jgi:hypothetical protein
VGTIDHHSDKQHNQKPLSKLETENNWWAYLRKNHMRQLSSRQLQIYSASATAGQSSRASPPIPMA